MRCTYETSGECFLELKARGFGKLPCGGQEDGERCLRSGFDMITLINKTADYQTCRQIRGRIV